MAKTIPLRAISEKGCQKNALARSNSLYVELTQRTLHVTDQVSVSLCALERKQRRTLRPWNQPRDSVDARRDSVDARRDSAEDPSFSTGSLKSGST